MKKLRRFTEKVAESEPGRVAYATSTAAVAKWLPGIVWIEDAKFHAGDAILADPMHAEGGLQGGDPSRLRCRKGAIAPRLRFFRDGTVPLNITKQITFPQVVPLSKYSRCYH
jgi:hypothetical protein